MRLRVRFPHPSQTAAQRLQRALRAASEDRYYAGLLNARAAQSLSDFPFSTVEAWRRGRTCPNLPGRLQHPLLRNIVATAPRPGRVLYDALAANAAQLLEYAHALPASRPQAEYGILALERPGDRELTETERDQLWDAFQVPVYRALLGFDGAVLAHECEALCGLHTTADALFEEHCGAIYVTSLSDRTQPSIRLRTALSVRLEAGVCVCGRPRHELAPAGSRHSGMSNAAD